MTAQSVAQSSAQSTHKAAHSVAHTMCVPYRGTHFVQEGGALCAGELVSRGDQSREDFARMARRYFGDGMKLYPINRDRALLAAWGWL